MLWSYSPKRSQISVLGVVQKKKYEHNREDEIIASLETSPKNTCRTFGKYSSCIIIEGDWRKSEVKTLVSDLKGGERTTIGCNVTAFFNTRHDQVFIGSWELEIERKSKVFFYICD